MRRSPSFRKVSRIGASTRSPSTGSAARAARWPCGGQKRSAWRSAKRPSAQAAPAVSAIAARQVRSWRETLDQVGQQRPFARLVPAEEMGAAGDVEQQAGIAAEAAGAAGFGPSSAMAPPSGSTATQGV